MSDKRASPSTVGRGKSAAPKTPKRRTVRVGSGEAKVEARLGDANAFYDAWPSPDVIVSDGAYGILGFEGDTADHVDMPAWYEPHVRAWAARSKPSTTLWFWNTEIGWASVHPVLERNGFRYVNCNVWNKGLAHVAGNVSTRTIRRFPVVTEVCVHYVREATIDGLSLKAWLLREWRRTGLPLREANRACGVADAAVRKYLDQGHLWYWPPAPMFARLVEHANKHGDARGKPYFSHDGKRSMTEAEWLATRAKFRCPHGVTNVWDRSPLQGKERIAVPDGRALHLNQKPIALMSRIIEASSDAGDVIWEPFGGLMSGSVAAMRASRRAFVAEIDPTYFHYGSERLRAESALPRAPK
jgi:site-specific DNA-methyltransferase (adenine-specific)